MHWITLRNKRKLKFWDNTNWWLVIALVKTILQYCKNPSLYSLVKYAILFRKNVSQKSDEISMVSNLVHFSMINQCLSLKILELLKKMTGKSMIKPFFLLEDEVRSYSDKRQMNIFFAWFDFFWHMLGSALYHDFFSSTASIFYIVMKIEDERKKTVKSFFVFDDWMKR